jgi:uncharacterized protein YceK
LLRRILLGLSAACCGCGTLNNLQGVPTPTKPYGGFVADLDYAMHGPILRPLAAIDAPFSLLGDTLSLPLVYWYQRESEPASQTTGYWKEWRTSAVTAP